MGLLFGKLISVNFAIQFIGWIISAKFRTEKFYDLTGKKDFYCIKLFINYIFIGSLTFILLTYLSRSTSRQTLRQNIQCSCIFIWALR